MSYRIKPLSSDTSIEKQPMVEFYWNNTKLSAAQGEKLSTALLANGIRTVGRSFKYGRVRGLLGYGVEEPNALVTLEPDTEFQIPNVRATEIVIYDQMRAVSATAHPSISFDWRQLFKPIHQFMPVGFYYKTFKAPIKLWSFYEKIIRQMAGFSHHNPALRDKESYLTQHCYGDVLIVGAGISGCQTAVELSKNNPKLRIILCEQSSEIGGETLGEVLQDSEARKILQDLNQQIAENANIRLLTQTTVFGHYDDGLSQALQKIQVSIPIKDRDLQSPAQKLLTIRTKITVLATGAIERPLLFKNNDLPGIMLASAARRYLINDKVLFARQPIIAGDNNSIYALAKDLMHYQVKPVIVDIRSAEEIPEECVEYCKNQHIRHYAGYAPIKAHMMGMGHKITVCHLEIAPVKWHKTSTNSIEWNVVGDEEKIATDGVAMSGGFNPVLHLSAHSGNKPQFDEITQSYLPTNDVAGLFYCGSVNGITHWQDCLQDSKQQVENIVTFLKGNKTHSISIPALFQSSPIFHLSEQKNVFVDFQTDVKSSDIALAIRENYRSVEHIKRYTATGFGTDQGKTSNINAIAIAAGILRQPMKEFATTTFRPPYTAVTFAAMGGGHQNDLFDAKRYTSMHPAHCRHNPVWELVGQWYRPRYYPQEKETMQDALNRECLAVRQNLAMMDVSTLGKIEIHGKDAREFLSRVYTNSWHKLPVGQCRYGIMCDEKGMIMDDGVSSCIDDNHFYMTTTTGGAGRVYEWMELWLQTEWQDLDVVLSSVTDQWAAVAVVGPQSREFMQSIESDIDFSAEAFPFMHWRSGQWGDFQVRIMRVSFSGELSFEINVNADKGLELWQSIEHYSEKNNLKITPYGTEAMHVLRAEKGFIIVGQDTDGSNTPQDMGMDWIVKANEKMSFIGERSQKRSDMLREKRKQLVGLKTVDNPQYTLIEGLSVMRSKEDKSSTNPVIGHITSSYYSPILGYSIALAVVEDGQKIHNSIVNVREKDGSMTKVKVCPPAFYDLDNAIMRG
jgi:sarcosine oxidase subunit alpha